MLGPWSFRAVGAAEGVAPPGLAGWMPAVVPGCVHTDLLRAGKIPDPFAGTNEKDLQWIELCDWEYRAPFTAGEDLLARERVDLVFEGLDTYAEVRVNGARVLAADNMFRRWRIDVRPCLRAGENEVLIRFRSPIREVAAAYDGLGYRLPANNDQAERMVSMFTRKAPYHYGWDWGPRFVTAGVWRAAALEAWDLARLDDVQVVQRELDDARARLEVVATVEAAHAGRARVEVSVDGGGVAGAAEATLEPETNRVSVAIAIDRPERWWPNGLGGQRLYAVETRLSVDGAARGGRVTRVGLRTVRVVHERDPDGGGKSFTVEVNDLPVFMKGANYIPSDSFVDRVGDGERRKLLRAAADAHMNMLRVWGGGVYEDDRFYDLCDELGILVWQDFMYACSMYPSTPEFLESARQEAICNVRRLRNHPSLALWAGNNEIEAAWFQWGWQERFQLGEAAQREMWAGYQRLFHDILARVVAEEDPGRFYTRSSPSANDDAVAPNALGFGDNHYWGVWHAEAPYAAYAENTSRFMSEYGFQSFPTLETVARYAPPSEWRIDSPVMLAHQRHPRGNALVRTYMERDFRVPEDFGAFLYLSQVLQATIIQYAAEAHRRRWPYCAGSLYWQLDDCWPVASWAGIDYYGRWKALHFAARRFFAPLLVSPVESRGGDGVDVFVVSDRREAARARLDLRVVDLDGAPAGGGGAEAGAPAPARWRASHDLEIPALSSRAAVSAGRAEILAGADPARVVLVAELRGPNGHAGAGAPVLARNLFYFAKARDLALPDPGLTWTVEEAAGEGGAASALPVRVAARRFARAVWLTAPGLGGDFSDNFFDLLPGESVTLAWTPDAGTRRVSASELTAALRAMTVRDTY